MKTVARDFDARHRRGGIAGLWVVLLLLCGCLAIQWFRSGGFFVPGRTITVLSGDSVSLMRHAPVRRSSVRVGRLGAVERYRAGGSQTTLELKDDLPVYANAVLRLRQGSLSAMDLVLDPGNDSAPLLPAGQAIPLVVEPRFPLAMLGDSAVGTAARQ